MPAPITAARRGVVPSVALIMMFVPSFVLIRADEAQAWRPMPIRQPEAIPRLYQSRKRAVPSTGAFGAYGSLIRMLPPEPRRHGARIDELTQYFLAHGTADHATAWHKAVAATDQTERQQAFGLS